MGPITPISQIISGRHRTPQTRQHSHHKSMSILSAHLFTDKSNITIKWSRFVTRVHLGARIYIHECVPCVLPIRSWPYTTIHIYCRGKPRHILFINSTEDPCWCCKKLHQNAYLIIACPFFNMKIYLLFQASLKLFYAFIKEAADVLICAWSC